MSHTELRLFHSCTYSGVWGDPSTRTHAKCQRLLSLSGHVVSECVAHRVPIFLLMELNCCYLFRHCHRCTIRGGDSTEHLCFFLPDISGIFSSFLFKINSMGWASSKPCLNICAAFSPQRPVIAPLQQHCTQAGCHLGSGCK